MVSVTYPATSQGISSSTADINSSNPIIWYDSASVGVIPVAQGVDFFDAWLSRLGVAFDLVFPSYIRDCLQLIRSYVPNYLGTLCFIATVNRGASCRKKLTPILISKQSGCLHLQGKSSSLGGGIANVE